MNPIITTDVSQVPDIVLQKKVIKPLMLLLKSAGDSDKNICWSKSMLTHLNAFDFIIQPLLLKFKSLA